VDGGGVGSIDDEDDDDATAPSPYLVIPENVTIYK
jgi:hypothetical protein